MGERIQPGSRVTFAYRVWAGQEVVDASEKPITIVVGQGKFFPEVEKALLGHEAGQHLMVMVPPDKHYGRYDPKKLNFISVERLPKEVSPGQVVRLPDEFGVPHPAVVRRLDREVALVDFNHPLAGKPLRFEIEILEVAPPKEAAQTLAEDRQESLSQEGETPQENETPRDKEEAL